MWQALRRTFVTGFFVSVPLVVSVVALVWLFQFADRLTSGLTVYLFGRHFPGLGIVTTAVGILAIGAIAANVVGRRLLRRGETLLMQVPVFRTIYAPVKQLLEAFSPSNEFGFKRVVMVEDQSRGAVLGFLTKEFTVDRGGRTETLLAVYVPTNHLYLGDVIVCPRERAFYPDLTVEQGIRIFLTGGMAMPERLRAGQGTDRGASR